MSVAMRNVVVAVLALLVAGVIVWLAVADERRSPADASHDTVDVRPAPSTAVDASGTLETHSPRNEVPTRAFPADAPVVDVLVVEEGTGAPIEGAEVMWDDGSAERQWKALSAEEQRMFRESIDLGTKAFGWTQRTDANGLVRVHVGPLGTKLYARAGRALSMHTLHPGAAGPPVRHRIAVRRDRPLVVQVRDANDRPAVGVPVALAKFRADGPMPNLFRGIHGTTTASGEVHLVDLHDVSFASEPSAPAVEWRVVVATPGLTEVAAVLDPLALPTGPIVLRLPATGSIAVRMVVGGRPAVLAERLGLVAEADAAAMSAPRAQAWSREASPDGWTRFPHVPLTTTFVVWSHDGTPASRPFAGPLRPGDEVEFELAPPTDRVTLIGRLLDDAGAPLENVSVNVEFDALGTKGGARVAVDGDGRFVWTLPHRAPRQMELHRVVFAREFDDGRPPTQHVVAARPLSFGVTDLGDLRLAPPTIVVAGRFQFVPGARVERVGIQLERFVVASGSDRRDRFVAVRGIRIHQRDDGRFDVVGDVEPGRLRLTFPTGRHLPIEPIEFAYGARDLVVDVDPGASLSATVRVPDDWPPNAHGLTGVLHDTAAPPSAIERRTASAFAGPPELLELRWLSIPAGKYTLELRLDGFRDPVHVVHDVVAPRPTGGDPRLAAIDLRDRIAIVTLRFDGHSPPADGVQRVEDGVFVFPQPQESEVMWSGQWSRDSELTLVVPRRPVDLVVAKHGSRPTELRGVQDVVRVPFEPWPEVEITCDAFVALPKGWRVRAQFAIDPAEPQLRYRAGHSTGGGQGLLQAPYVVQDFASGRARLPLGTTPRTLRVVIVPAGARSGRDVPHDTPPIAPGTERVAVRIAPEDWQRVIAELQQPTGGGR